MDQPVTEIIKNNHLGAQSQTNIEQMVSNTEQLFEQYRVASHELAQVNTNNTHLQTLISHQLAQIVSLNTQLSSLGQTSRQLTPMMLDMIKTLETFVQLDLPFLLDTRTQRLHDLTENFHRNDMSIATKYQSILDVFLIENEYGRTIESYRGSLQLNDNSAEKTVDYFRLGRVALYYLSLDGQHAGVWNHDKSTWEPLPANARQAIKQGIAVAKEQQPPQLLSLSLPAPKLAITAKERIQ